MYDDIKTCALYVRYSSNNQTEQSIEGQLRVCKDFCARYNMKIVEVYADRAAQGTENHLERGLYHSAYRKEPEEILGR